MVSRDCILMSTENNGASTPLGGSALRDRRNDDVPHSEIGTGLAATPHGRGSRRAARAAERVHRAAQRPGAARSPHFS